MNRIRLLLIAAILIAAWTFVASVNSGVPRSALAQAAATETGLPQPSQAYITNTFEEAINVRLGPSTIFYANPCGSLAVGANAMALGTTPAHEWVKIEFADCPGGVGWVYAANVTVTGALREVEPPPTPMPLATATLDPTLMAAFQIEPTVTRLPTFTPPPPLVLPTFAESSNSSGGFPAGAAIVITAVLGSLVLAASLVGRR
ncbi:MAG TPA: hypothetical protein VIU38_12150 [Anaerolineales bacterium]